MNSITTLEGIVEKAKVEYQESKAILKAAKKILKEFKREAAGPNWIERLQMRLHKTLKEKQSELQRVRENPVAAELDTQVKRIKKMLNGVCKKLDKKKFSKTDEKVLETANICLSAMKMAALMGFIGNKDLDEIEIILKEIYEKAGIERKPFVGAPLFSENIIDIQPEITK